MLRQAELVILAALVIVVAILVSVVLRRERGE